MEKYITVLGDTWDMIAYRVYGDETYARDLIKANPKHIYTVIFSGGIELNVPAVEKRELISMLPPWKRGNEYAGT
ncbi:phage tail protein X [Clostridium aceticum]|uniref:Phage tail protein X n=1 Tax=Clostridium aceticum TaxID=84022 RepID=A0A0D8ICB9_9CLOT|nr:tail protein X [Clostridium aceticum]AKL95019.1 phage tail protein X [Clostridium aceticum]KJF27918.1 hypothetical protein TZ02_04905 [Clostridium aceticum]